VTRRSARAARGPLALTRTNSRQHFPATVPAESLQADVFVLSKQPPSDAFQTFILFSAEHGTLLALQRLSKKVAGTGNPLDLFDEAAVFLETSNQGRTWFVKEARILVRHATMGRSYEALQTASALSGLVSRNHVAGESRAAVAELLRTAFAAFAAGARPDVVYFKSLYRFARDEGYPLKQQWFPLLPADARAGVAQLINRPVAEQTATPAAVARLQRQLEEYLRTHTEILLE
jgi:hypothetical protein